MKYLSGSGLSYYHTKIKALLDNKAPLNHNHSWTTITNKPSSFTPSTHNHDSSYYKKTETYSKNEIDGKIGNIESVLSSILGV